MRTSVAATLAVCGIALAACQQKSPSAPRAAHPLFALQDGAHNSGNPDFFFLPPMVGDPSGDANFDPGAFDPNLQPVVVVCALTGTGCGATVAQFSMTSGTGSEQIRVDAVDGYYIVNWHTDASTPALDPALNYRIVVSVGATQLGFADVDVVSSGKELRNVQTGEYIGLKDGRTLPIKFRIEDAALCDPPGTRPCTSEAVDIGADAPEHTILLYTDAGEPYGALRTQPQAGLDPGTVVTFTLQPCDGFTGDAASAYTQISDCLHITADPPIPEILPNGFDPKATVSVCTPISIPYPAPAAAGVFRQDDETGEVFELDHTDENICVPPGGAAHRAAQWHTGLPPAGNTGFTSRILAAIPIGRALIDSVLLGSYDLEIEGPRVSYTAFLNNQTATTLSSIQLQAWIQQGDAKRAAGGTLVTCTPTLGSLPPGLCQFNFSLVASNAGAGVGTLVGGSATARFELGDGENVLDTLLVPITLDRVDQSNDPPTGTSYGCGGEGSLYQSLTPALSPLTAVELRLRAGGSYPTGGISTTINVRDGGPAGTILGTATAFAGIRATGDQILLRFTFTAPITITTGNPLVIEWITLPDAVLTWMGSTGNPYAGGTAFNCAAAPLADTDYNFKTLSQ